MVALAATTRFWRPRLAFRPMDIVLGFGAGVIARAVALVAALVATGTLASGTTLLTGINPSFLFTTVLAPVVLAPLIEELFFRGLLQNALGGFTPKRFALLATSVIFTGVHIISEGASTPALVTLLVYSLTVGYLAQKSERLGGPVIAHATFNSLGVAISWPWGI